MRLVFRRCMICEKKYLMDRHVCHHCAPRTLFTLKRRKGKYALLLLLVMMVIILVIEGLWAAGVFVPHPRLRPVRKQLTAVQFSEVPAFAVIS